MTHATVTVSSLRKTTHSSCLLSRETPLNPLIARRTKHSQAGHYSAQDDQYNYMRKAPLTSSWSLSALTKSSVLTAVSGNVGWTVTQPAFLSIASGQEKKER